eukprot:TRINITY_DN43296_c0_g1_i1.p1 TRINITY_DN43296_c0_g1~~TRINITY_DN43296_c0_g1_i1.p1  ORF type:complete len:298 (+),score=106.19 TRINITY_DN43296_c0_g1_i1:209-1102(+)
MAAEEGEKDLGYYTQLCGKQQNLLRALQTERKAQTEKIAQLEREGSAGATSAGEADQLKATIAKQQGLLKKLAAERTEKSEQIKSLEAEVHELKQTEEGDGASCSEEMEKMKAACNKQQTMLKKLAEERKQSLAKIQELAAENDRLTKEAGSREGETEDLLFGDSSPVALEQAQAQAQAQLVQAQAELQQLTLAKTESDAKLQGLAGETEALRAQLENQVAANAAGNELVEQAQGMFARQLEAEQAKFRISEQEMEGMQDSMLRALEDEKGKLETKEAEVAELRSCLLYTSPSPRDS